MLPDIPSVTDNFLSFCQFLAIFCPLLPNNRDIGLLILGKCSLGGKMEGLCKLVTVTKKNKNVCKLQRLIERKACFHLGLVSVCSTFSANKGISIKEYLF